MPDSSASVTTSGSGRFEQTHWSLVVMAGAGGSPEAHEALEKLCGAYWYPLYAFARRSGRNPHDAQDSTQGFFEHLLESNLVAKATPGAGRFRSFLLKSFKNFMGQEWRRSQAEKRGGKFRIVSIDDEQAETRYSREPCHDLSPDRIYERHWAMTLIQRTLARLEGEWRTADKGPVFEQLKGFLTSEKDEETQAELAERLGLRTNAVKQMIFRMRHRFRSIYRHEVAHTVFNPEDIDAEIQILKAVLRG